jgi:molecular chaperone Hsp33
LTIPCNSGSVILTSEQIPSAFHLSVKFNKQGKVTGAGGLALHAMTGADKKTVGTLADHLEHIPSLGELFEKLILPEEILSTYFPGFDPWILSTRPVRFFCSCSKNWFKGYIAALPQEDLEDILENGLLPMIVTCHNCSSSYSFEEEEIIAMIK